MHRYKKLEFWQRSTQLSVRLYEVTETFPRSEVFGLTSQMRRSAVSIASNIAEGCSRKSNKDFSRFLDIAVGSAYELDTQILIARQIGYIDDETFTTLQSEIDSIIQMTVKFKSRIAFQ